LVFVVGCNLGDSGDAVKTFDGPESADQSSSSNDGGTEDFAIPDKRCNKGTLEEGEECDVDTGLNTCENRGFDGGILKCQQCKFDTSGCHRCGDGIISGDEACDTLSFSLTCSDILGFPAHGIQKCSSDCSSVDDSQCSLNFIDVVAGGSHSCAIRSDGQVECWGDGSEAKTTPPMGGDQTIRICGAHMRAV